MAQIDFVLRRVDRIHGAGGMGIAAAFMDGLNIVGGRMAHAIPMRIMASAGHGQLRLRHAGGRAEIDAQQGSGVSGGGDSRRIRTGGQRKENEAGKRQWAGGESRHDGSLSGCHDAHSAIGQGRSIRMKGLKGAVAPVSARAAPIPGPYGDGVGSGGGSGRLEIRRDRAVGEGYIGFPIYGRHSRERHQTRSGARRHIGDRNTGAKAAGKATGAVVLVRLRGSVSRRSMFMSTRGNGRKRRGKADRAAAYQGKRAQDQQKILCPLPHT
jgi:hypothetical protein